jgi:GNAT superfamily N-acetyltransferase
MNDPVAAFDEVAVDFLGDHYWLFFNDDPTRPSEEWAGPTEDVGELIRAHWDTLGLRQRPVFVLHHLQLPAAHRGQGKGREAYEALERKVAQAGIGAIILQAGMLDDAWRHSLGFWRKMGFEEWPGDYWIFPDRIMVKVLP